MLRPFNPVTMSEVLDTLVLTSIIDNNLTCAGAETSPNTIEHLAGTVVSMVRHNQALEAARIEQHLQIPVTEEIRTIVKEGRTFGVITGGKGV
jgi:hypothetical protein